MVGHAGKCEVMVKAAGAKALELQAAAKGLMAYKAEVPMLVLARGITGNMPASSVGLRSLLRAGRVSRHHISPLSKVIRTGLGPFVCNEAVARSEVVLNAGTRPARAHIFRNPLHHTNKEYHG